MKYLSPILTLILAATCLAQTPSLEQRLTALERDVAAIKAVVKITGAATRPTTQPTPATKPAKQAVGAIGLVRGGGSVSNKLITTAPKGDVGIQVIGNGVTIRDVEFAADGGYLIQVNNAGTTIDGLTASTFSDYAIYVQGAKDTIVRNMTVIGGSTKESILRLDDVDGFLLEDAVLDYRPVPVVNRKAVIRGHGARIKYVRVACYGAVVGATPMTGFDAGEAYIAGGMLRIHQSPWIVTVENRPEWMAAVKAVVAEGAVEHEDILRRVLGRVPARIKVAKPDGTAEIQTLPAGKIDIGYTARERVRYLAQRADATFTECTFVDAPIRNSAGGTQRFFDCLIVGEPFTGWNEPTYPNDEFLLPRDVKRPAPVTEFTRCDFDIPWTLQQLLGFARANGIVLIDCKYKGQTIKAEAP